jgi:hypothetical protein
VSWEEKLSKDLIKVLSDSSSDDLIEFRAYFNDLNTYDEKEIFKIARGMQERYHIGSFGLSCKDFDFKENDYKFVGWYIRCDAYADTIKPLAKDKRIKKLDIDRDGLIN